MLMLKQVLQPSSQLADKLVGSFDELEALVQQLKTGGYTIVLTQGVYDMFHVGHGRYLAEAGQAGDVLIVGLDSDELTREMKGEGKPFDSFADRAETLAFLSSVRIIVKRDVGQGHHDLIKLVKPNVLIMSQTTTTFTDEDKRALEPHCGEIRHLEAKAAMSTTAKIRRLLYNGTRPFVDKVHTRMEKLSTEIEDFVAGIREDLAEFDGGGEQ